MPWKEIAVIDDVGIGETLLDSNRSCGRLRCNNQVVFGCAFVAVTQSLDVSVQRVVTDFAEGENVVSPFARIIVDHVGDFARSTNISAR